jgi:predicted DNA-binding ArsR family transcriptional regulator
LYLINIFQVRIYFSFSSIEVSVSFNSLFDVLFDVFEVLHRVRDKSNMLYKIEMKEGQSNWSHLEQELSSKHVMESKIEEKIEGTGKRGLRRKQLLGDLKEKRIHWNLREEALDRTLWTTRSGRGYGPVVRQITQEMSPTFVDERRKNVTI